MNTTPTRIASTRSWTRRTLPSAIVLALMATAPAYAATAPQANADQDTAGVERQQNASADNDAKTKNEKKEKQKSALTLGTIQVTATGRAENIVLVPYNISAVSGKSIEQQQILDNSELFSSLPGVQLAHQGARGTVVNGIRIRGINTDTTIAGGDFPFTSGAPVSTYVDNVPLYANFLLFDLNRVEVLRGPQGTLYGSGSLGGTVRYIMNKPVLDYTGGSASLALSNVHYSSGIGKSAGVILNLPIGHSVAIRFDGKHNDYPGYTDYVDLYKLDSKGVPVAPDGVLSDKAEYTSKKDVDTVKQDFGRVSMLWKPNDKFDLQLSYMTQAGRFGGRSGSSLGADGYGVPYERGQIGTPMLEPAKRHINLTSLEASLDLGFATLTSSTSYYKLAGSIVRSNTGFYADVNWWHDLYYNYPRPLEKEFQNYSNDATTQEFRLVSKPAEHLDWIMGLYYHNQHETSIQNAQMAGFKDWWDAAYPAFADAVINDNDYHYDQNTHYRETALYGQLTWHITSSLDLTGGFRHFKDDFTATVDQHVALYTSVFQRAVSTNTQSADKTQFFGNMSWWFTDRAQLYATISQGYRHGGANGTPITGPFAEDPAYQFYKADTTLNHEIGIKGITDHLTYTADVFYVNWQNPQLNTQTPIWGFLATENVGSAVSKGAEFQVEGHAGEHFRYNFGYAYTDAYLSENAYSPTGFLINYKGAKLPGVSKNHLGAGAAYKFDVAGGSLVLHLDGAYQSPIENNIGRNPKYTFKLGGFTIWNASANFSKGNWDAILWLKNITNTRGITGVRYNGPSPAQNFYGSDTIAIEALPRTVGVTLSYKF